MPNGHLSGARRASCMPGGYSLYTNFRESCRGEVLRIPLGNCPKRGAVDAPSVDLGGIRRPKCRSRGPPGYHRRPI
jgi:hypothetical protein